MKRRNAPAKSPLDSGMRRNDDLNTPTAANRPLRLFKTLAPVRRDPIEHCSQGKKEVNSLPL